MTGGVGEGDPGGGVPDDDYLRLDGANNNAAPSNYMRRSDGDARWLQLTGGTVSGTLTVSGTFSPSGGVTGGAVINSYDTSPNIYEFQTRNVIVTDSPSFPDNALGIDGDIGLKYGG